MSPTGTTTESLGRFFKKKSRLYILIAVALMALGVVVGMHVFSRAPASATTGPQASHVTLASVSTLSANTSSLPLTGKVTSLHQATILAQSAGEITAINKKLGNHVVAGEVIATLENSSQVAAVVQAQGAYAGATAQLQKIQNGGSVNQKDISAINNAQAAISLGNSRTSVQTTLQAAYTSIDDAIHTKTDALFTNPKSFSPVFNIQTSNSQLSITILNQRPTVEQKIADVQALVGSFSSATDVDGATSQALADIQYISDFLTNVTAALNSAIVSTNVPQATVSGYQASVALGRSEVTASIASLNGAKTSYDATLAAAAVAGKQVVDTSSGRTEDIAAAQANVEQARGALNAAQAILNKTIIRSPLSGTIVTLPLKLGDYITAFSQAAIVSNPNALEVVTYVTADDARTITIGGKAVIGDANVVGIITSIAPALDPTTNKIEVHIGIPSDAQSLSDGSSVTLNLSRADTAMKATNTNATSSTISIPIVALKITPSGPVVFTVNASSTLMSSPVTLGSILGDRVVVIAGLTPLMTIVSDARGHAAGETVIVDTQ